MQRSGSSASSKSSKSSKSDMETGADTKQETKQQDAPPPASSPRKARAKVKVSKAATANASSPYATSPRRPRPPGSSPQRRSTGMSASRRLSTSSKSKAVETRSPTKAYVGPYQPHSFRVKNVNTEPGPGEYVIPSSCGKQPVKKSAPQVSFGSGPRLAPVPTTTRDADYRAPNPGNGQYPESTRASAPKYSFGVRHAIAKPATVDAPFMPTDAGKRLTKSPPAWSFSKSPRMVLPPGQMATMSVDFYDTSSKRLVGKQRNPPSYSFAGTNTPRLSPVKTATEAARFLDPSLAGSKGQGKLSTKRSAPSYSFGASSRPTYIHALSDVPFPPYQTFDHPPVTVHHTPRYGFGTSGRETKMSGILKSHTS